MKVVILAGGFGTRLTEETEIKPKPMIEIGGKPILWHIMKIYSYYGFNDFVICLGYKGYYIKEYFHHYYLHQSDVAINLQNNQIDYLKTKSEPWKVALIDTGLNAMTGSRIKSIQDYTENKSFLLTYGDGLADININELIQHHKDKKKYATVTAVRPTGRFGALKIKDDDSVLEFQEKPEGDRGWINGGFFVLEPEIFKYISNDPLCTWEKEPLSNLAKDRQLNAFKHYKFWQPMDTLRDKRELDELHRNNNAPWKIWKD